MIEPRETAAAEPRVLVVDDEPDVLELLMVAMTSLRRYEVVLAESAATALREIAASRSPFDVFLLDIQMPTMGGVELLGEIRRMPRYAQTPVIMLTAMSDRDYVDAAFRHGAHDYVTKPFDYDDLLRRIDFVHGTAGTKPETSHEKVQPTAPILAEPPTSREIEAFAGIERLIGRFEFDNYISQLSRGRLYGSCLIGVMLCSPGARHRRRDARAGADPVILLARSISQATKTTGSLFCHLGADTFIVLAHEAKDNGEALTEEALNKILQSEFRESRMSNEYKVMVGEPIRTRDLASEDIAAAMREAAENAERRERVETERSRLREIDDRARATSRPDTGANLFEQVLREMYGGQTYLDKPR
jgi:DNA-binding response OmpR family regulator